ncbi:ABC transporter permease [Lacticaseibacillus absianus]|uniref:ABC transporter permease n=1 Tax=Lacticaseibacillus absianus TaxID=2729623 RepID=UPI0015CC62C6|nr:ABC transporter permease subunit [Lacticaseibacillus absianus]
MLLPAVIILFVFAYLPMYGIVIAFQNYSPALGVMHSPWVGFANFNEFLHSYQLYRTLKNTLVISFYSLFVGFPLPVILALLTHQLRTGMFKKTFQVITYLPHFISTMIICGMLVMFLSPNSGLVAMVAHLFKATAPNYLAMPKLFSSIVVWSDVWQNLGWDSIIYLAALAGIDPTLYEAATIDGATKFDQMRHIDYPLLMPTVITLLILRAGGILGVGLEKVLLLQNNLNITASEVISTYVYKMGLLNSQFSLSTAIGLFNAIINFALLLTVNKISKHYTDTSLF